MTTKTNDAAAVLAELTALGWTFTGIANHLKVRKETVTRWNSGTSTVDPLTLAALKDMKDLDADKIQGDRRRAINRDATATK